jgi:dihydrofolate reductase
MRSLIVTEFITLDGVVEAPGGEPTHPHAGWTMALGVPELYAEKMRETVEAESLLLGRVTFEGFSTAWPQQTGDFADKFNTMPKHVATSGQGELGWNATALSGDVETGVAKLKQEAGGPIYVHGSATLVRSLLTYGLVDELRLMVFPVIIGGGKTIWPQERLKVSLELTELVRYDSGVLLQVYRPTD